MQPTLESLFVKKLPNAFATFFVRVQIYTYIETGDVPPARRTEKEAYMSM